MNLPLQNLCQKVPPNKKTFYTNAWKFYICFLNIIQEHIAIELILKTTNPLSSQ